MKAEQKAWLSGRDRQCPGTKCLLDYMNERQKALAALGAPSAAASGISCKPYGKRGARLSGAFTGAPVNEDKVVNEGSQPASARIEVLELSENGKKVLQTAAMDVAGTAENSAKGLYFEFKPKDSSPIKEILIGAPAGGRGNSSVTTRKGDEYTMDCE